MKRKLIEFDVFKKLEGESLSNAERELALAEDVLAKAVGTAGLKLHCFSETTATYETVEGTFVHAGYQLSDNTVTFSNIEELVVDESTERKHSKAILSSLVDSLLENREPKASALFSEFMSLPVTRRSLLQEGCHPDEMKKKGKKGGFPFGKKGDDFGGKKKKGKGDVGGARVFLKGTDKKKGKKLEEWGNLCRNVYGYLEYKELGPVLHESQAMFDDKGNAVAVRVPTSHVRNEGKILKFNWKTMSTDVVTKRGKAKAFSEDVNFCKAMADLKRQNAASDNNALQETLEAIVTAWPDVLFLTQDELSAQIAEALQTANARNWDSDMCEFMADGILQTAHHAYSDRAAKLLRLAGVNSDGKTYEEFKGVIDLFLPTLDEHNAVDNRVFSDLYAALYEVHELAKAHHDEALKAQTLPYLRDIYATLQGELDSDIGLVEAAADYLAAIVEANLPGAGDWKVSNSTHITPTGEHPHLKSLPKVDGIPGKYHGDYGDKLPVSDGKSYRGNEAEKMRSAWMNWSSEDTYPALKNPYIPKPFGKYTMKGEKGVDQVGNSDLLAQWQSGETWPALQNPVVPKKYHSGTPVMSPKNYKMKSDNLVVDK